MASTIDPSVEFSVVQQTERKGPVMQAIRQICRVMDFSVHVLMILIVLAAVGLGYSIGRSQDESGPTQSQLDAERDELRRARLDADTARRRVMDLEMSALSSSK
jgi:hypothetical protein